MLLGFDIGGTKCAVITANYNNDKIEIINKKAIPTDLSIKAEEMINKLIDIADELTKGLKIESIGVSCGGPLDSKRGIIQSPPNLPGWDNVEICSLISKHFNVKTNLQNDANACAYAEWKFGAGKNTENMNFLTFGTVMGAGLILNGKLYSGTNDNAGECGHIRLDRNGPAGYGKIGSFEGFCSGGGLAQLGLTMAKASIQNGYTPSYYSNDSSVTAKAIAESAINNDPVAIEVYKKCGEYLGEGLSILIDILNPEMIVIGSIYTRSEKLLYDSMISIINVETLQASRSVCEIKKSELNEAIGDYAAIAVALL